MQQHYINTHQRSILVRDVTRLIPTPASEVHTLAGFFGVSDIGFSIAPDNTETTVSFSCRVHDIKILLAGPHMHEWGVSFTADFGPEAAPTRIIDIPRWEASMRDEPPVHHWTVRRHVLLLPGPAAVHTAALFRLTRRSIRRCDVGGRTRRLWIRSIEGRRAPTHIERETLAWWLVENELRRGYAPFAARHMRGCTAHASPAAVASTRPVPPRR